MPSVLIVDDDVRIQELLLRWLQPAGHVLRFAENSNAALALLAAEQPAVIVCDVHMPGANGLWLADRVRALAPATAIVLATGDVDVPPYESLRPGVVAYVLKPLQRDQFLSAIGAALAWARAAAEQQARRCRGDRPRLPAGQ